MLYNLIKKYGLITIVLLGLTACGSSGGTLNSNSNKVSKIGVILEYIGCKKVERDLQCDLFLTADGRDMTVGISSGKSVAFDDAGNKYLPKSITIANEDATGNVYTPKFTQILADTKTPLTFVFENISTKATEIKRLEVSVSTRKPERHDNVAIQYKGNKL